MGRDFSLLPQAKLVFVNWMVPATMKASYRACQAHLANLASVDHPSFLGLMLLPTWTYHRGQLHLQENLALKQMVDEGLNVDRSITVMRGPKPDPRDSRPRDLKGQLLVANTIREDFSNSLWKHCSLVKDSRVYETPMLSTGDMLVVEELEEGSLPRQEGGEKHVSGCPTGSKRYEQIGEKTSKAILDATIDGLKDAPLAMVVVIVDVNPVCGGLLEAFVEKRLSSNVSVYYFGLCQDDTSMEFIREHKINNLTNKLIAGSLTIPGVKIEKDMPAISAHGVALVPDLKTLVYDKDSGMVFLPTSVGQKWGMSEHSPKLEEALKEGAQALGYAEGSINTMEGGNEGKASTPVKRRAEDSVDPSSTKKPKFELSNFVVPLDQLSTGVLTNLKMGNVKGDVMLRLLMGSKVDGAMTNIHTYIHINIHTYTHTHIHTHIHTRTHSRVHAHILS